MATLKRPNFMSAQVTFSAEEVAEMKREADEAGKDWREIAYRRARHRRNERIMQGVRDVARGQ